MSLPEAIEGTRETLLNSVKIRLRSDVPLAFCLSGGVDSAGLVSIATKNFNAKIKTFSIIDSDERYNEKNNIMETVRDVNCDYSLLDIPKDDVLTKLHDLIEYHDAPIATITYYIQSLITASVHEDGYRVAFSGTSADELFTGYYDHFLLHLNEVRLDETYQENLHFWRKNIEGHIRNPVLKNPNLYVNDPNARDHIFDASKELQEYLLPSFEEVFVEESFCDNLLRNRTSNELLHEVIPVILHEEDLNSMYYSVENRSPYLDSNLQKFAYSIPPRHLIREGYGKFILREALKGILNDKVRLDRQKKGFNASINSLVNLKDQEIRSFLLDPKSQIFEIIDREKVEKLLDMFPIPNHFSKFIFNFINARIFLEKFS